MPEPTLCCRLAGGYCDRCDLLVGLTGLHVTAVERDEGDHRRGDRGGLMVSVESPPGPMAAPNVALVTLPWVVWGAAGGQHAVPA